MRINYKAADEQKKDSVYQTIEIMVLFTLTIFFIPKTVMIREWLERTNYIVLAVWVRELFFYTGLLYGRHMGMTESKAAATKKKFFDTNI